MGGKLSPRAKSATLHQKVVVTRVEDIWRAHGVRAYNGGLGAEPPAGSRDRAPGGGQGTKQRQNLYKIRSRTPHGTVPVHQSFRRFIGLRCVSCNICRTCGLLESFSAKKL